MLVSTMTVRARNSDRSRGHRLHKPGVAGSSPAAATSVNISHEPAEEYHLWPETSCSQLKELRSSPLAFYFRHMARTSPPKSGDALAFGSLLHLWAELTDKVFWKRAVVAPESVCTATGTIGAKGKEWVKTIDPASIPISIADAEKLRPQTRQILRNKAARELLESCVDREFNVRWEWDGHKVRCRVDGATANCFYDLKTTRDKEPLRTFHSSVWEYGYHLQAAMYGSAAVAAGWPAHRMVFIVTSTVFPYVCECVRLPEPLMEIGRRECLSLLDELQQRLEWDCWEPSSYGEVHELWCPKYMLKGGR